MVLGETTPGPLIRVVVFMGFIGAMVNEVLGADALVLSGFLGTSVATFFTFLLSFLFIFLGGAGIETTRGNLKFNPLIRNRCCGGCDCQLSIVFYAGNVVSQ